MDKIIMKGMKFFGYHGVYPEEQANGQIFMIDIELFTDLRKAGLTDELENTIDYSQVYNLIKNITESSRFRLLEKLADVISQEIMSKYKSIREVKILVKKPDAPISGEFDWVGIEISRSFDE